MVLAAVCALGARPARACGRPCEAPPLEKAFAEAAVVFSGVVEERADRSLFDRVTVRVTRAWKGEPGRLATISVESHTCDPLGDMLAPGDRVLLFAAPPRYPYQKRTGEDGELVAGLCAGSAKLDDGKQARARLEALDRLARRKKTSPRAGGR